MFWGKDFYKNFQVWADSIKNWHPEALEKALDRAWEFIKDYSPKVADELVALIGQLNEEKLKKIYDTLLGWLKKVGLLK